MFYRYFIELQYNGKDFHGWQIQPNVRTVQSVINEKLTVLLKAPIESTGAGRTDTGVHARFFVAHFDTPEKIETDHKVFVNKLNRFLPADIFVFRIIPVRPDAHARFDAISRTYKYYITLRKDVFLRESAWFCRQQPNIALLQKGAEILSSYNDFTSFSKLHSDTKSNICQIKLAEWSKEEHILIFTIKADRFLRDMVRAVVGTLLLLGRKKISVTKLKKIIEGKDRSLAGESVPAHGLYLHSIEYPYIL